MALETNNPSTHITNLKARFRIETSDPLVPRAGDMYFNPTTSYLAYYTGSVWLYVQFT